jgi:hypothetical protein
METQNLAVASLQLDPNNPRLPEDIVGSTQSAILKHLLENEALEELAQSMADSGFFPNDPLIVLRQDGNLRNVVVEGNRRLATLKILLGEEVASGLKLQSIIDLSSKREISLKSIPCIVVDSRDTVSNYIGFRHIGGLKLWPPEAKARYVWSEIERLVKDGAREPFRDYGRRIGSNAQGVRGDYVALGILKSAQEEASIKTQALRSGRFGVWKRALNLPGVREFIRLADAQSYDDVQHALRGLHFTKLKQIISDLSPSGEGALPLIRDSRQLDDYGRILKNPIALKVLRKSNDFDAARQLVVGGFWPEKIEKLVRMMDSLIHEIAHAADDTELPDDLQATAEKLASLSRSLLSLVRGRLATDD